MKVGSVEARAFTGGTLEVGYILDRLGITEIKTVDTLIAEGYVQVLAIPVVLRKAADSERAQEAKTKFRSFHHIHI